MFSRNNMVINILTANIYENKEISVPIIFTILIFFSILGLYLYIYILPFYSEKGLSSNFLKITFIIFCSLLQWLDYFKSENHDKIKNLPIMQDNNNE